MRSKIINKIFVFFIALVIIFNSSFGTTYAGISNPKTGILGDYKDAKNFQALTFTVNPVDSTSSIQAFAVGWKVKILDESGCVFDEIYISTPPQFSGTSRKYYLPLSKGFSRTAAGNEVVSGSIESKISTYKVNRYRQIVSKSVGSTFLVDAHIQKYTYNSSRSPKYLPANPACYADNMDDINNYFSEFSTSFKNNLPGNYFDLSKTFAAPEPVTLPDPKVNLTLPINGLTVLQGTVATFKGFGTGVHHISGFVDGEFLEEQSNPNEDINEQMKFETTVKLDEVGDYTFQIMGRNTANSTDAGSKLTESEVHTVHVIKPPANSGTIYIKCFDIDTNKEIPDTSYEIPGVEFGKPKIVTYATIAAYKVQGSYQTFSASVPDKSKMETDTSQTITLSSTNKKAYVYFWYKADNTVPPPKPPPKINYDPIAIINNPAVAYAGDDVAIDGSQSYDEDGYIEHYYWNLPGTDGYNAYDNSLGDAEKGTAWYPKVGVYGIDLEVVDDGNCSGYGQSIIEIIEPKPEVVIDVSADKMKENRKITLDTSKSKSAARFPIDWSLTAWSIQPVDGTGATGDYGARLQDGTVYKNVNNIAYLYKGGAWQNTGVAFISVLKGQKTIQFQARDSGQYKITVSLTNTSVYNRAVHYSNTLERTITIVEDLPPSAAFNCPESVIREHDNPLGPKLQKYGICEVSCTSVSPDGDPLGKRVWGLRYDSDNDVDLGLSDSEAFEDETTIEPYTGSEPFTSGIRLVVDNEYDSTAQIWSYKVGYTTNSLQVFEDIPDSETVKELLIPSDFKSGYKQGW